MPTLPDDFATTSLTGDALKVADAIVALLTAELSTPSGGGCRAFYSPKEWEEREEQPTGRMLLALVHDGGDLARYVNYDYMDYGAIDRLNAVVGKLGYYVESFNHWSAGVYPTR